MFGAVVGLEAACDLETVAAFKRPVEVPALLTGTGAFFTWHNAWLNAPFTMNL